MEKKLVYKYLALYLVFAALILALFFFKYSNLTGFAVFQESSQQDFNLGNYNNTFYNESDIILAGENLTGTYTSKIFDASTESIWNSLSFSGNEPNLSSIYVVDGSGAVYYSADAANWIQTTSGYGGGSGTDDITSDITGNLYIVLDKKIYKSADKGVTWGIVKNGFSDKNGLLIDKTSDGSLYAIDTSGGVWKSLDYGVTWASQGDFNGAATNDAKGMAVNSSNAIYVVDGSGAVYYSADAAVWIQTTSGYGGGAYTDDIEADSGNNLYILLNKKIYKSTDNGVSWNIINNTFTTYSQAGLKMLINSNDIFIILDEAGKVFKSTDYGITWDEIADFNGAATNDAKGITEMIQATNLSFQVKNCSNADCSNANWQDKDLRSINLQSRYFQYKASFTSPDTTVSPGLKSVSIDYMIINRVPSLTLIKPQDGATYGYNTSIPLQFSVSDEDDNLAVCWYSLDSGNNILLDGCQNTTFNTIEGSHALTIYANDSYGLETSDSALFNVQIGSPTITLVYPLNISLNLNSVEFRYIPEDTDLDSCELWGDFSGIFEANQININPSNGVENTFSLNLNDGNYLWNIRCNDSQANSVFNGNKSFIVDTVNPRITISQPTGTKTSKTITASWEITDMNIASCWYNVYRGTNLEIGNTSVDCSSNAVTFSVTLDADFIFNFYANDSSGNFNFSSTIFTVSTFTPPGSSGGGGGGGRSITTTTTTPIASLEISEIGDVVANPEESKTLSLTVKNTGQIFLNKCKITGKDSGLISSRDVKGLSIGQQEDFVFVINVPEDFRQDRVVEIDVECEEVKENSAFNLLFSKNVIEAELISTEQKNDKFNIIYNVKEKSGKEQEIKAFFFLEGLGVKIEGEDNFILKADESLQREFNLDLPRQAGEYSLNIKVTAGTFFRVVNEPIIIGNSAGLLGRALLIAGGNQILFTGFFAVLLVFIVIYVIRRIIRKPLKEDKTGFVKVKLGKK